MIGAWVCAVRRAVVRTGGKGIMAAFLGIVLTGLPSSSVARECYDLEQRYWELAHYMSQHVGEPHPPYCRNWCPAEVQQLRRACKEVIFDARAECRRACGDGGLSNLVGAARCNDECRSLYQAHMEACRGSFSTPLFEPSNEGVCEHPITRECADFRERRNRFWIAEIRAKEEWHQCLVRAGDPDALAEEAARR